jgi:hypothetical protein
MMTELVLQTPEVFKPLDRNSQARREEPVMAKAHHEFQTLLSHHVFLTTAWGFIFRFIALLVPSSLGLLVSDDALKGGNRA